MMTRDAIRIDAADATARIEAAIRHEVLEEMRRRGAVVALSGGVDSSVVAALCARALGPDRVLGLLLPERDSSSDALRLGTDLARHLGIEYVVEDIEPTLAAVGCYQRQDEAIRMVFPEYGAGLEVQARPPVDPRGRSAERLAAHRRRVRRRDAENGAHAAGGRTCSSSPPRTSSSACGR